VKSGFIRVVKRGDSDFWRSGCASVAKGFDS
jgi:hypothetical protein